MGERRVIEDSINEGGIFPNYSEIFPATVFLSTNIYWNDGADGWVEKYKKALVNLT